MILRGLAEGGGDLALVRERVDRLYWAVCRKHLRTCKCKNVEKDALLEIYAKLMYHSKTNTTMTQAKLVNGVVLQWKGNHYTNANLTDEVAREFLNAFPIRKDWFAVLPSASTEKQVVAEVAEMPSAEVSDKSEPTTKEEKDCEKTQIRRKNEHSKNKESTPAH